MRVQRFQIDAFSVNTLSVFERIISVDGRPKRIEMYAFSNENALVRTGPEPISDSELQSKSGCLIIVCQYLLGILKAHTHRTRFGNGARFSGFPKTTNLIWSLN